MVIDIEGVLVNVMLLVGGGIAACCAAMWLLGHGSAYLVCAMIPLGACQIVLAILTEKHLRTVLLEREQDRTKISGRG